MGWNEVENRSITYRKWTVVNTLGFLLRLTVLFSFIMLMGITALAFLGNHFIGHIMWPKYYLFVPVLLLGDNVYMLISIERGYAIVFMMNIFVELLALNLVFTIINRSGNMVSKYFN